MDMTTKEKAARMINADRAWNALLYLFQKHSKLQNYLKVDYFDFNNGFCNVKQLLNLSKSWSTSEQFMLKFAIHLFNGSIKVDLNNIDYLDLNNKRLVNEAIKIRFKGI